MALCLFLKGSAIRGLRWERLSSRDYLNVIPAQAGIQATVGSATAPITTQGILLLPAGMASDEPIGRELRAERLSRVGGD